MVEEKFYTPEEVAKILNVSLRVVQDWIKEGKIAHYEITSRIKRVPESVVDKLLNKSLKPRRTRL